MKDQLSTPPILFLEDWTSPPKCGKESEEALQDDVVGLNEVKKWRLQTLLAVNPWGIPLLAFNEAYRRMYGKDLDLGDLGFDSLTSMVYKLNDVFTIQEPDEVTALMFPDYAEDMILHDARLGHTFEKDSTNSGCLLANKDPELLLAQAWFNRDDEFPPDVVLPGDEYTDKLLPVTLANVPGTRGIHQAVILSAASPDLFYISIKSESLNRIARLPFDVAEFFKRIASIDKYWVPAEFIYAGFPCLVYVDCEDSWERCEIVDKCQRSGKVLVESVDYGGVRAVHPTSLYLMPRQFIELPKQALRVSMVGLRPPNGAKKWPSQTGKRLRCFSNQQYWLDCLLLEPKEIAPRESSASEDSRSSSTSGCASSELSYDDKGGVQTPSKKSKKKRKQVKPDFEIILCDRNDDDMDIYVEEILFIETYADKDMTRQDELKTLKDKFDSALKGIPRPENPLAAKSAQLKVDQTD